MPGFWIQTYSTRTFRLDRPDPRDVNLADIAHALATMSRFNGHTRWSEDRPWGYSVAQHSVLVSEIVVSIADRYPHPLRHVNLPLLGLLHDAHEAYTGDMCSPLKRLLGDAWAPVEAAAEEAVRLAFSLPVRPTSLAIIKDADVIALATEARDLLPGGPIGWTHTLPEPLPERVEPWSPLVARERFTQRFWELSRRQERERRGE